LEKSPLPRFTERSIVSSQDFLREVTRAREQGYAIDDEEYLRGIRAVAAPIRYREATVAAMWVVGFVSNLTDPAMERASRELLEATGILSRLLETRSPS
jgi:DNA-binding IclR family transcriptional regulator